MFSIVKASSKAHRSNRPLIDKTQPVELSRRSLICFFSCWRDETNSVYLRWMFSNNRQQKENGTINQFFHHDSKNREHPRRWFFLREELTFARTIDQALR
jgi:hypothetical protein